MNSYGQDPRIHALQSLTWSLWLLGFADSAQRRCDQMTAFAERTGHPFGLANALLTRCNLELLRRDRNGVANASERLMQLAETNGFVEYAFRASFFQAWYRACVGEAEAVLDKIGAGYELYKTQGGVARTLTAWATADIYRMAGRTVRCLEILDEALAAWTHEELVYEAGLLWMKGVVLGQQGNGRHDEARDVLTRSINVAHSRHQAPFVLRSAVELYRLEKKSNLYMEFPKELLKQYVDHFEGQQEPDFLNAKTLLSKLLR